MTLTEENAQKTGPQSFTVNNGKVTFGCEAGAYAELDLDLVKLDRTLWTVTYTDGVDGEEIFATQASNVPADVAGTGLHAGSGGGGRGGHYPCAPGMFTSGFLPLRPAMS